MSVKLAQLEKRVHQLEAEVRQLKRPTAQSSSQKPWYDQILGMFDNDPGFEEMVRLGKQIRDSDRGLSPVRRKSSLPRKGRR